MNISSKQNLLPNRWARLISIVLLVALVLGPVNVPVRAAIPAEANSVGPNTARTAVSAPVTAPASTVKSTGAASPVAAPLAATTAVTPTWVFQGPAPEIKAQQDLVNVPDGLESVSGAVTAIAPSRTNPDLVYLGTANGGVWKSTNATAATPTWTPLTDKLKSQSISTNAVAFDPTDVTSQTLIVGTGRFSGYANRGDDQVGIYYTTDGGATWTTSSGTNGNLLTFSNNSVRITGVAARGNILLAATSLGSGYTSYGGLFRTTGGPTGTWTQISGSGGLPNTAANFITGDPLNPNVLYVGFLGATGGLFKTTDLGATWTNVTSGITGISSATTAFNAAVFNDGATNVVYALLNGANGNALFRSVNGAAFTALDLPGQFDNAYGTYGMAVDKTNSNLVYVSGGYIIVASGPFLSAVNRIDASRPAGSQATLLYGGVSTSLSAAATNVATTLSVAATSGMPTTYPFTLTVDSEQMSVTGISGTTLTVVRGAGGTTAAAHDKGAGVSGYPTYGAPHVDVNALATNAGNSLFMGTHGSLFRLPQPGSPPSATNYWVSKNGNLGVSEIHDIAYDHVSHVLLAGLQDNCVIYQTAPLSTTWTVGTSVGDGGDVAVTEVALPTGTPVSTTMLFTEGPTWTDLYVASVDGFPAGGFFYLTGGSEQMFVSAIRGAAYQIATATQSGNTVTINTTAPHGLVVGTGFNVRGVSDSRYNSAFVYVASVPSSTSFTYNLTSYSNLPAATGGIASNLRLAVIRGVNGTTPINQSGTVTSVNLGGSVSVRYTSSQGLSGFTRQVFNASNVSVVKADISYSVITDTQFTTPIVVNAVDSNRLAVGGSVKIYESLDAGGTFNPIALIGVNQMPGPVAYGGYRNGVANPDVLYVGFGSQIYSRTVTGGALAATAALPAGAGTIKRLVINPTDWQNVFATDDNQVFESTDGGATWLDITGSLVSGGLSSTEFNGLEFVSGSSPYIALGTRSGVFASRLSNLGVWFELGDSLPDVLVFDLEYDATDDVLVAGTLGRAAWLLPNASAAFIPSSVAPVVAITSGPDSSNEGTTQTYEFTVTDPGDTFTVTALSVTNGITNAAASVVTNSLSTTISGGKFQVSFLDGPATGTINLQVTDSTGLTSNIATKTISAINVNATPTISNAPASSPAGTPITLTGSATDPSAADLAAGMFYQWKVLQPGNSQLELTPKILNRTSYVFTPTMAGTYQVYVDIWDKDATTSSYTSKSIIATTPPNVAPVVAITSGATSANEGTTQSYAFTVTDLADSFSVTTLTVTNGITNVAASVVPGTMVTTTTGGNFQIKFLDGPATGTINLQVTDSTGLTSNLVTKSVSAVNVVPTTAINGPTSSVVNTRVDLTSVVSDTSAADQSAGFTYYWFVFKPAGAAAIPSGTAATFSYTPTVTGIYTTYLNTTDKDGGMRQSSKVITVAASNAPQSAVQSATPLLASQAIAAEAAAMPLSAPVGPRTVAQTLFIDNFDSETTGLGLTTLSNWNVTAGNLDVYAIYTGQGLSLDMDGTAADATIQTKTDFTFTPGTYRLSFKIGNNQYAGNGLHFTIGSLLDDSVAATSVLTLIERQFTVAVTTTAPIVFTETGPADDGGSVLDDVQLVRFNATTANATLLTTNATAVTADEGLTALNWGTFWNVNDHPLTLTASVGTLQLTNPSAFNVAGYWKLGEDDPGATAGGTGTNPTLGRDGNGLNPALNLTRHNSPVYTSTVDPSSGSTLAMTFSGNNSYVLGSPVVTATDNFGLDVWFMPTANLTGSQRVIYNGTVPGGGFGIDLVDMVITGRFSRPSATIAFNSGVTTTVGSWYHVIFVRDNGVPRLYVNDALVLESGSRNPPFPATDFSIGSGPGLSVFFVGAVDEARVFTFTPGTWTWSHTPDDGPVQSQSVTITATDTISGEVTTLSFPLTVNNVAPTATFTNDGPVNAGTFGGTVSFSGQFDPSTTDTTASIHYAYDFDNDGVFEIGDGTYAGSSTNVTATVPANFLATAGVRTVLGRILDKDGGYTDYTTDITIMAVNHAPMAVDDHYNLAANGSLTVPASGVLINDTDADGNALSAIKVTDPAHGVVTLNADGSFTYTPTAGFVGSDAFTYKANDGALDSNVATVTLTILPANHAPVAVDDNFITGPNVSLTVSAAGVLSNDTDVDGDPLTAIKVTDPAHGVLTLNADGSFTYTPNAGFAGLDSFTYRANDGKADSNVATVTINVAKPTASVSGPATALATQRVDFLLGAVDPSPADQNAGFTYNINWGDGSTDVIPQAMGNGSVMAHHAYAAVGNYTVQVTATDENNVTSTQASTTIQVNALTTASLQALIGTTSVVNLAPINNAALQNQVSAINGLTATLAAVNGPTAASPVGITIILGAGPYSGVTLSPANGVGLNLAGNYTADGGAGTTQISSDNGPAVTVTSGDVFVQGNGLATHADAPTVLVTGGHLFLGQSSVQESTNFNNVAIKVAGGTASLGFDMVLNVNGAGSYVSSYVRSALSPHPEGIDAELSPNDFQHDGVSVHASYLSSTGLASSVASPVVGQSVIFTATIDANVPEHGPVTGDVAFYDGATLLGTGTVSKVGSVYVATFTTSALSAGTHTIAAFYSGDQGYVASSATLAVVVGTNAAPVAVNDAFTTTTGVTLTIAAPGVLGNDTDADGNVLTAIKVTNPAHGTLTLNADGSFVYVPTDGYYGSDSFTYKANDGTADSNVATVTITVKRYVVYLPLVAR